MYELYGSTIMKIWSVTGHSESGDDYGPWLFNKKPTDEQLEAILKEDCPGEFEEEEDGTYDGPGSFGSYVHLSNPVEIEVIEL
jgi:hypothetical protein